MWHRMIFAAMPSVVLPAFGTMIGYRSRFMTSESFNNGHADDIEDRMRKAIKMIKPNRSSLHIPKR